MGAYCDRTSNFVRGEMPVVMAKRQKWGQWRPIWSPKSIQLLQMVVTASDSPLLMDMLQELVCLHPMGACDRTNNFVCGEMPVVMAKRQHGDNGALYVYILYGVQI